MHSVAIPLTVKTIVGLFATITIFCSPIQAQDVPVKPTDPHHSHSGVVVPKPRVIEKQRPIPPPPPGVTDLKFTDFLVTPVGRYGFEMTEQIKALNGKKVRIYGYMVRREEPVRGTLLLTATPVNIVEHEAGFADLPVNTLLVEVPWAKSRMVPYTNRPLLLMGTLQIGPRQEKDHDYISNFRLVLDEPEKPASAASVEQRHDCS